MDPFAKRLAEHYARQQHDRVGAHARPEVGRQVATGNPFNLRLGMANAHEAAMLSGRRQVVRPAVLTTTGEPEFEFRFVASNTTVWKNASDHSEAWTARDGFAWNHNLFIAVGMFALEGDNWVEASASLTKTGGFTFTVDLLNADEDVLLTASGGASYSITSTWDPAPPSPFDPENPQTAPDSIRQQFTGDTTPTTFEAGSIPSFNAVRITAAFTGTAIGSNSEILIFSSPMQEIGVV